MSLHRWAPVSLARRPEETSRANATQHHTTMTSGVRATVQYPHRKQIQKNLNLNHVSELSILTRLEKTCQRCQVSFKAKAAKYHKSQNAKLFPYFAFVHVPHAERRTPQNHRCKGPWQSRQRRGLVSVAFFKFVSAQGIWKVWHVLVKHDGLLWISW